MSESGSISLPRSRHGWLGTLRAIYEFESARVSGPASSRKDIRDVLWSLDDVSGGEDQARFVEVMDWMVANRHAMRVQVSGMPPRFITRVGETVRLLGHTPEYWPRGRPGIEAVRWLLEDKKVPRREIPVARFVADLQAAIEKSGKQEWRGSLKDAIPDVVNAVARVIAKGPPAREASEVRFSKFQLESATRMLLAEFGDGQERPAQVIVAGVGSGKTHGFLIPTLVSALARLYQGDMSARQSAIILYPRKALARDQHGVFSDVIREIDNPNIDYFQAHFEHYEGYSSGPHKESVKEGIERVYQRNPPAVIVTTLETLKRRLNHPLFASKVASRLSRVVIDEVHLVEGLGGGNVIRLMDRLRAASALMRPGSTLLWTASSATVASPHAHVGMVLGLPTSKVHVIAPDEDEMETVGLAHHVFIRPSGKISSLGALVNATSILVHNRRVNVGRRARGDQNPKTIGFADNLDLLGRWNADLRENERTERSRNRDHPDGPDRFATSPDGWGATQRELPYALRFHNPLQRRLDVRSAEEYPMILQEHVGDKLCERCRAGERVSLGVQPGEVIAELQKIVYRDPIKPKDEVKAYWIRNSSVFDGKAQEIGTLDLCPYLRAGACQWFPMDDDDVEAISEKRRKYEWKSVVRSKLHTAKTSGEGGFGEDLADVVFKGSLSEVYDLDSWSEPEMQVDVVLASPSLEVGIDLKKVTESVMFHAIRNVASYRQKAGRIGREEGSDAVNVTLIDGRPIDLHYYRQPRKLISLAQLDPIPLKDTNEYILRCGLYTAVWDWLAIKGALPEAIPLGIAEGDSEFSRRLEQSLAALRRDAAGVKGHLRQVSRGYGPSEAYIDSAIAQVDSEISLLLTDVKGILEPGVSRLADVVPNLLSEHGRRVVPARKLANTLQQMKALTGDYRDARSRLDPLDLGLSDEFQHLDAMQRAGWTKDGVARHIGKLEAKLSSLTDANQKVNLRRVVRSLEDMNDLLSGMAVNPIPLYFYDQFNAFVRKEKPMAHYLSFLMENLDIFRLCRVHPAFVRIRNLFSNPYEEEVELSGFGREEQRIPLDEALFSMIPGTWTYRLGKKAVKVRAGQVVVSEGGILRIDTDQLNEQGSQFVRVKPNVRGPPGFPEFEVVRPTRLALMDARDKYVTLDLKNRTVLDGDEGQTVKGEGDDYKRVKIPKSYLNRWVHVQSDDGSPIRVNELDTEYLAVLDRDGMEESSKEGALPHIKHPLAAAMFDKVSWHKRIDATEFVYSASRTYTSTQVSGMELVFETGEGGRIAFGQSIQTEGISIDLNPDLVKETHDVVVRGLVEGRDIWKPSMLKCLTAYLSAVGGEGSAGIGSFVVRDLMAILSTYVEREGAGWKPEALTKAFKSLVAGSPQLEQLARSFYRDVASIESSDEESFGPSSGNRGTEKGMEELEARIERLREAAESLEPRVDGFASSVDRWVYDVLLNSFGLAATNALERLAGVGDSVIGYAPDLDGVDKGQFRIYLYDKDVNGSGSSEVGRKFMHILHAQRHGTTVDSKLLPSDDFLTLLEEELLQCPQHHSDMSALEMLKQRRAKQSELGIPELGYVAEHAREVLSISGAAWEKIGIRGKEDAWRLPILRQEVQELSRTSGLEVDDLIRATTICWNGCPECILNGESMIGGMMGEALLDKMVLDELFRHGRGRSEEYLQVLPADLAGGRAKIPFGDLSKVVIDRPDRRIRSVSLPYTVGVEVGSDAEAAPGLIVRTSDIDGMSLYERVGQQPAHGIGPLGFRRLLWHDLVMTAYLDLLGLLPKERRKVEAVFYDARDIEFQDVGVSPRMLDAIVEYARVSGARSTAQQPERLSDMLAWLSKSGFEVTFCLDKGRLRQSGVASFVKRLRSSGCVVVSKDLADPARKIHPKAIATPLGVIEGSANLTLGGIGANEEIVSYAPYGTQAYVDLLTSIRDKFHGTVPVTLGE
ncbi:MAG: DEAD/DEAH box helicase [Nitrososphaerota archaeon]|nr:DEAD/DEAH box helicase [Nitrososphaerota archaeon]